jgi:hypothetical protein
VSALNTVGLAFTSDQASTLVPRLETVGAVTLGGGANTIRVNASAALVVAQLSLDSLTRTNNATAVLLGSFMEDPVSARRGDIVVRSGTNLVGALVGGGGLAGSPNISILPWAVGTNAGANVTFMEIPSSPMRDFQKPSGRWPPWSTRLWQSAAGPPP